MFLLLSTYRPASFCATINLLPLSFKSTLNCPAGNMGVRIYKYFSFAIWHEGWVVYSTHSGAHLQSVLLFYKKYLSTKFLLTQQQTEVQLLGEFHWHFSRHFFLLLYVVQVSSVSQEWPTLCNPMNCSTPVLPVHHQLPEFTQTNVHWVGDAIQPSYPLLSPSPPALNLSQHQGLFQWVSSSHQVAKVLEFQLQHQSLQWTPRTDLL